MPLMLKETMTDKGSTNLGRFLIILFPNHFTQCLSFIVLKCSYSVSVFILTLMNTAELNMAINTESFIYYLILAVIKLLLSNILF